MRTVMNLKKRVGLDSKSVGLYMFTKLKLVIRWQMVGCKQERGVGLHE